MASSTTALANKNSKSIKKETFKGDSIHQIVIDKMTIFFKCELFCDVILIDKDETLKINAHKMVLSAASKYFLLIFGGLSGELSDKEKEVKLHQTDARILKIIIDYIYTDSIDLTTDTVQEITKAAYLFEMDPLKVHCCEFIEKHLEPFNCLGIGMFAEQNDLRELYKSSEMYALQNFTKVRNGKEFFDLDMDHLKKFLSSSKLQVESEEEVFECLMSWVDHDKEQRETYIEDLVLCLRFPQIKPLFIVNVIEPKLSKSKNCKTLVSKALKWHLLPELRSSLFCEKFTEQRRQQTKTLFAIRGWGANNNEKVLNVGSFDFETNQWIYTTWPAPPVRRNGFKCIVVGDKLVLAGGDSTNRVDCLDLKTHKWTDMKWMQSKRQGFGLATLNGCIYAFGGVEDVVTTSDKTPNSMEKWDPLTKKWKYISGVENILSDANGKYLVASKTNLCAGIAIKSNKSETIYHIYNPSTETWNKNYWKSTSQHLGFGTVKLNEKEMFIIVTRESILKHNLENNSKFIIEIEKIGNEYNNCTMFDDYIVLFGGTNKLKIYYPFTNEWKIIPDLDKNSCGGRIVLL